MTLYRTYRPRTFAEVVGQDAVVTTLENAVKKDKLSHAYLFWGVRGTGKTSVARILAKAMMTQGIEDETQKKNIIKGIEDGSLVDLLEIDAASHTQVEKIRELIEKIQFSPVVASAKVYIIDEVHMLSKSAFNALLKTLEEPPDYAYFILATTAPHKVLDTIRSRCQQFTFKRIRDEDIIRHLQYIADQEKVSVERGALRSIAAHVQGGMRDAIALLDQLRSLENITEQDVLSRIGQTSEQEVDTVLHAIEAGDKKEILEIVKRLEESAIPLEGFLRLLLGNIRLSLHKAVQEGSETESLLSMLDTVLDALKSIRSAPVQSLVVESTLLRLCPSKEEKKRDGFFFRKQKDEKEDTKKEEDPLKDANTGEVDSEDKEEKGTPGVIEAVELSLAGIEDMWPQVIKDISPPSVKMSLKNARLFALDDRSLSLSFPSAFHRDKVCSVEASRAIETVLEKHLNQKVLITCILEEEEDSEDIEASDIDIAEAAQEVFKE